MINYFHLFLLSLLTLQINAELDTGNNFTIISPAIIQEQITRLNRETQKSEIPYNIGKFGDVPYGKTVFAMLFLHKQSDGSNYWCDYSKTSVPDYLSKTSSVQSEYIPMYVVDQGQCSYSKKAYNVQLRKGGIMLIIDDDNDLENNDKYNVADLRASAIKIPTLIIPRNYGEILKSHLETDTNFQTSQKIIVSFKFSAYNPDGTVKIEVFMSSDDINAAYFYKEFETYKKRFGEKLKISPIYKYHNYPNYESNNDVLDQQLTVPCFDKGDIKCCANQNNDLKVSNPRIIIQENLRQSCVFILYKQEIYWNYMIEFTNNCLDLNDPDFTKTCSENVIKKLKLKDDDIKNINECLQNLVDLNSKVDEDYELYDYRKVYQTPMITINGVKYTGKWLPKNIYNFICNSFIDDKKICYSSTGQNLVTRFNSKNVITVLIVLFVFFALLLLCYYRRMVKRSLHQSLIEKIQFDTMKKISKYNQNFAEKEKLNEEEPQIKGN